MQFHDAGDPANRAVVIGCPRDVVRHSPSIPIIPYALVEPIHQIGGAGKEIEVLVQPGVGAGNVILEVGRDPLVRACVLADRCGLQAEVAGRLVRHETFVIKVMGRVIHSQTEPGQRYLVEVIVGHAPEGRSPGNVQGINRSVFLLEPIAEARSGIITVVDRSLRLVVQLPANHVRVSAVASGQLLHNSQTVIAVEVTGKGSVLAAAVDQTHAVFIDPQDLRMPGREPGRRGGGRRAKDDLQTVFFRQSDRLVQPFEMVYTLLRLQSRPGKLAHVDKLKTQIRHLLDVALPLAFIPMLGVVKNSGGDELLRREESGLRLDR